MIKILGADSYGGFSAWLEESNPVAKKGAQPIYVGRLRWPNEAESTDAVIKLYETSTCGVANEVIGYVANALCGVSQPSKGAALLLPQDALPSMPSDISPYIDAETGIALCWATSLEQGGKPFKFMRKLSTFSEQQVQAFYKSKFCQTLTGVDHGTGNNDRHEGNFLYIDDFHYKAIDQGAIGGSPFWHTMWPDGMAKNELLTLVHKTLKPSQKAPWHSGALLTYEEIRSSWARISDTLPTTLRGLLEPEQVTTIIEYMARRVADHSFEERCGFLC